MNKKLLSTIAILFTAVILNAQTSSLTIGSDIQLPKDSIECSQLIADLNSFLLSVQQQANIENKWILPSEKLETEILIGEIKDINEKQKSDSSLKPHLNNAIPISKEQYLIQFSYLGTKENIPYLQALFEIVATKINNTFQFSSTLKRNTKDWKTETDNHLSIYYSSANKNFAEQYAKYIREFDAKLKISKPTAFYFCEDCETLSQLLQLSGIQYQQNSNGLSWIMTGYDTPDKNFDFFTKRFSDGQTVDPHDAFHSRASIAIPEKERNNSMICGCAYIYGGSWLISWTDIQKMFKAKMNYNKKTDWLKLYFDRYNFGESVERHLLVTQFINALIIQKVEKEQGFTAVMKLLASGNMFKDRTKFFKTLEEVTGINEKNFNKVVGNIIDMTMVKI